MRFPAYPKMKPSGVDWLGDIPDGWSAPRFKYVLHERKERSDSGEEELLSVSAYTGVKPRSDSLDAGDHLSRAESLIGYKNCSPGDLVMNIMLAWNRGLGIAQNEGIVSPAYSVFKLEQFLNPAFADYLLRSDEYIGYYKTWSTGVIDSRLRLYPDTFGRLFCLLPSPEEQRAIAAFLDRETAAIDALLGMQRELVALLKEKRQAVISHAVTKGLDPTAPMKPSGIDWLGDIPAHWHLMPLKRLSDSITVGIVVNPSSYISDSQDDLPFIYGGDVREDRIDTTNCRKISADKSQLQPKTILNEGDIVVVRVGAPGVAAVVSKECVGGNCASIALVRRGERSSRWLMHTINSRQVRYQVDVVAYGAAQKQFNIDHLVNFSIPVPPVEESYLIANNIDQLSNQINALIAESESAIALLSERRAALISAAVTGKIDVRGLVDLPETEKVLA